MLVCVCVLCACCVCVRVRVQWALQAERVWAELTELAERRLDRPRLPPGKNVCAHVCMCVGSCAGVRGCEWVRARECGCGCVI